MKTNLLIILSLFVTLRCFSQTIPVGNNYAGEAARIRQVLGLADSLSSFSIRPISLSQDTSLTMLFGSRNLLRDLSSTKSGVNILPVNWQTDYNFKRPYGYNNGSFYPNRGLESRVSAGIFFKSGILRVQLSPELVYAQNRDFATFSTIQGSNNNPQLLNAYFAIINGIDAPERFGNSSITRLYAGQSKITVNLANIEAGVSTENIWWGPGVQNAIMMTNSAPGFLHWTLNSVKPGKTAIGSFEWQIIGGILKQSGYLPTDTAKLIYGHNLLVPKPATTRYISAFTVNWHPKWIDGLFLGITEYDYLNRDSAYNKKNIARRLFPVLIGSSLEANQISAANKNGDSQDFAFAFNIRQVLTKYNAEIYFEWARNDRTGGINDFLQEPEHASAYTFGGRRLFELAKDKFLQVKMELTHLQDPPTYLVRGGTPIWYVHLVDPRDGYTNDGRYLGAGIGPGSNSLMFDISFLKGQNSYGITVERLVHDNDLYYSAFTGTDIYTRHWVDLNNTFYANLKMNNYVISAELTPVYSLNYEYQSGTSLNLHARISLTYYFN